MDEKIQEGLLETDLRCLWHPYTQMKDFEQAAPLFVDWAQGAYLYDGQGARYYDTISSWWCILHGHNHPVIKASIRKQLDRLEQVHFAGTTHEGAIRLAEQLVGMTPPALTRVFYSDNGSTACEVAIKMSVQYWKQAGEPRRERFVALERGYHGDTIGTMSLGGVPTFEGPFEALRFPSYRIPCPYCYRCPRGMSPETCSIECLDSFETLLREKGDEIAGVILEPMLMGAGGMIAQPPAYLRRLSSILHGQPIHLILDEVATGFGRTGKMFALEHVDLRPDFLCLSKGLTAGYLPMAATLTTEEVYRAFYADYSEGKTFFHGHTFTGNPLAVAAGLASLEVFREEKVLEGLETKVSALQQGAERLNEIACVGDVRGVGMVTAFEMVQDRETKQPFPAGDRIGWQIYRRGLSKGLILRPLGDVVYLFLPLCVTVSQIEDILDRTYEVLSDLKSPQGKQE